MEADDALMGTEPLSFSNVQLLNEFLSDVMLGARAGAIEVGLRSLIREREKNLDLAEWFLQKGQGEDSRQHAMLATRLADFQANYEKRFGVRQL